MDAGKTYVDSIAFERMEKLWRDPPRIQPRKDIKADQPTTDPLKKL